jgi:hypothetical protein
LESSSCELPLCCVLGELALSNEVDLPKVVALVNDKINAVVELWQGVAGLPRY